ncbi:hypothetical protein GGC63_005654 [Paenibacillus sp. OAS669]|nr:hypothetical protein [Paenibacillus sp. OAS669]
MGVDRSVAEGYPTNNKNTVTMWNPSLCSVFPIGIATLALRKVGKMKNLIEVYQNLTHLPKILLFLCRCQLKATVLAAICCDLHLRQVTVAFLLADILGR